MYRLIEDSRAMSGTVTGELIFSRVNYPRESFKANKITIVLNFHGVSFLEKFTAYRNQAKILFL